ncbi:MAG: hypothetical protein WD649_02655 [Thermoleophilaceae bacterium]
MNRRAIVGLIAYVLLVGSAFTPLYEDLGVDTEDGAAITVVLLAQIGVGAAVGRAWVLALPVLVGLIAFFASGAEGLAVFILIPGIPVLAGLAGVGWALASWLTDEHKRRSSRRPSSFSRRCPHSGPRS